MSGKVKILTSLCATMIMMVVAISSIFAATSASLGITCTVSYTATNYVGNLTGTVTGLTGGVGTTFSSTNEVGRPLQQNMVWNNISGNIAPNENGVPSLLVFTYTITNRMSVDGIINVTPKVGNSAFALNNGKYICGYFELTAKSLQYLSNNVPSPIVLATIDSPNISNMTINPKGDYDYNTLILEFTFKVINPSQSFTAQNINFAISLERVL